MLSAAEEERSRNQNERLGRSLVQLSTNLYSKNLHFVLELVQNAGRGDGGFGYIIRKRARWRSSALFHSIYLLVLYECINASLFHSPSHPLLKHSHPDPLPRPLLTRTPYLFHLPILY